MDKAGKTIDFLFRAKRDKVAARRFFEKSIAQNGVPETVTIDKSSSQSGRVARGERRARNVHQDPYWLWVCASI